MDGSDLSRRDTIKLARFGLLLAAGIGISGTSEAGQRTSQMWKYNEKMLKIEANSILLKLYEPQADGKFVLLRTSSLPAVQAKGILSGAPTQFTIKWSRNGQVLGTLNDVMQKV